MPPAYGKKVVRSTKGGDLRFEETSDYQTSDDRLSDRSTAGWPFLAIAAGCVEPGDFSIPLRSTRNDIREAAARPGFKGFIRFSRCKEWWRRFRRNI